MRPRVVTWWALGLALLLAAGLMLYRRIDEPLPSGRPGLEADALARTLAEAVHLDAWQRTKAVRFVFEGARRYLWDRERGFASIEWGEERVLLRVRARTGRVFHAGLELSGSEAGHLLYRAHRFFVHDSFWLNPFATLFDRGVVRELVILPSGERALLVRYASSGHTTGDSYLFEQSKTGGLPRASKMWVSILPFGGVQASWEHWQTLRTGALVATEHKMRTRWLTLSELDGAATLAELVGPSDPFALLVH
jgi:hypothetical protein